MTHNCDVTGCGRVASRFTGSKRIGWVYFCSVHRAVAYALSNFLFWHRSAR